MSELAWLLVLVILYYMATNWSLGFLAAAYPNRDRAWIVVFGAIIWPISFIVYALYVTHTILSGLGYVRGQETRNALRRWEV